MGSGESKQGHISPALQLDDHDILKALENEASPAVVAAPSTEAPPLESRRETWKALSQASDKAGMVAFQQKGSGVSLQRAMRLYLPLEQTTTAVP